MYIRDTYQPILIECNVSHSYSISSRYFKNLKMVVLPKLVGLRARIHNFVDSTTLFIEMDHKLERCSSKSPKCFGTKRLTRI